MHGGVIFELVLLWLLSCFVCGYIEAWRENRAWRKKWQSRCDGRGGPSR